MRAVPLLGGWLARHLTDGNRRNLALLRAHVEAGGADGPGRRLALPSLDELSAMRSRATRAAAALARPLRALLLWGLIAVVLALPLALGAGVLGLALWLALKLMRTL